LQYTQKSVSLTIYANCSDHDYYLAPPFRAKLFNFTSLHWQTNTQMPPNSLAKLLKNKPPLKLFAKLLKKSEPHTTSYQR